MRNLKKLASIVLAAVMTLALMVPAFATQGPEATITIKNTLQDKTYEIYKIFDMTVTGTDDSQKVAYSIANGWEEFFTTGAGANYLSSEASTHAALINVGTETKYLLIAADTTEADNNAVNFADDALAYALAHTDLAKTTVTGTGSDVTQDLPYGYYLTYLRGATQKTADSKGSLCSLTNVTKNVELKIKATTPTIDKTADEGEKAVVKGVGDTVTFTITGKVPDTTNFTSYTYRISDKMTSGLTFNEDVAVTIDNAPVDINGKITYADNGFVLTLDKTDLGTAVDAPIVVTYTAVVNANAIVSDKENNSAKLEYSNDPNDPTGTGETVETVVDVYDVQIDVDKYALNADNEEDHSNKLAGAQFALKNADNKYYKYTPAAGDTPAALDWVDNVTDATVYITNAAGKLAVMTDAGEAGDEMCFKGLSPANVAYTLEEVEAPAGYNKLADGITVSVTPSTSKDNTADGTWVKVSESEGVTTYLNTVSLNHVEEVMNSTGAELPETGGMGTTLFYALGGLLVVGAGILLITKKRMGAE